MREHRRLEVHDLARDLRVERRDPVRRVDPVDHLAEVVRAEDHLERRGRARRVERHEPLRDRAPAPRQVLLRRSRARAGSPRCRACTCASFRFARLTSSSARSRLAFSSLIWPITCRASACLAAIGEAAAAALRRERQQEAEDREHEHVRRRSPPRGACRTRGFRGPAHRVGPARHESGRLAMCSDTGNRVPSESCRNLTCSAVASGRNCCGNCGTVPPLLGQLKGRGDAAACWSRRAPACSACSRSAGARARARRRRSRRCRPTTPVSRRSRARPCSSSTRSTRGSPAARAAARPRSRRPRQRLASERASLAARAAARAGRRAALAEPARLAAALPLRARRHELARRR